MSTITPSTPRPVLIMSTVQTKEMTYTVHCPALDETEVCYSQEHAIDVCLSMHNESGAYAYVEDYLGHTVVEYGDIVELSLIHI